MTSTHEDYPSIAEFWGFSKPIGRFNDWNERKWISATDEISKLAFQELSSLKLSPRAHSLVLSAKLTSSSGIEFVMVSNAEFPCPIGFEENGIVVDIVPCFVPLSEQLQNQGLADRRHSAMAKRGIFIYDGWISCSEWTREHIEKIELTLDRWLNMLAVTGGYFAYWEPKYYFTRQVTTNYLGSLSHLGTLGTTMHLMVQLSQADQNAINRSVAWISAALREDSSVNRFLLLFVSIESLATYIERQATNGSLLLRFAAEPLSKEEKRQSQEECIKVLLTSEKSLTEIIPAAYFDCIVGSKALVERHINRMFGNDEIGKMLFREKIGKKTLWELRSDIAHGSTNILSNDELTVVEQRVRTLEDIAIRYIRLIFTNLSGESYFEHVALPSFILPATQAIAGPMSEYNGPTEMAEYYANIEILSNSTIDLFLYKK